MNIDQTGLQKMLVSIRRKIHSHPELGHCEIRTSSFVKDCLNRWGIKTKTIGKTGVMGLITIPGADKCVALRADMDALPIQTKIKKPYASRIPGVMHACGHDANTTIILGSAYLLSKNKDALNKNIKFIFQPAEETSNGAASLISRGVLKNPNVDMILGVHVHSQLRVGTAAFKKGPMMAAVDRFEIQLYGGGGHAAYPHLGKDTVLAGAQLINLLQNIVSRQSNPLDPVVVSVCKICGGDRFNVLADQIYMEGTVRTLNPRIQDAVEKRMKKILASVCSLYGLKYDFKYQRLGKVLSNDSDVAERLMKSAKKVDALTTVKELSIPSMGGEDFAEYLEKVKGCFIYFGCQSSKETSYPWHHPKFDIDERVLSAGAYAVAQMAIEY